MRQTFGKPPPLNQADAELEAGRLLGLLRHFRIPYNDPDAWFVLATALARKHYPQGAPNPTGRPRLGSIAKLYGLARKCGRPRGRPRRDEAAGLFSFVSFYKQEHPRATDKAAITALLKETVRCNNVPEGRGIPEWRMLSERRMLKEHLGRLQQALSRYRGRLRRTAMNAMG